MCAITSFPPSPSSSPSPSPPQSQATVLKEVLAVADYTAQYEDELTFRAGDKIQITLESELDIISQHCIVYICPN